MKNFVRVQLNRNYICYFFKCDNLSFAYVFCFDNIYRIFYDNFLMKYNRMDTKKKKMQKYAKNKKQNKTKHKQTKKQHGLYQKGKR